MVLLIFLIIFRVPLTWWILAMPLVLLLQLAFTAGLALLLAAFNVFYRDVMHFTDIALMAWFWMTPIVYPISFIHNSLPGWAAKLYMLNPMTHIVLLWQRITYNSPVNGPAAYYWSPWGLLGTVAFAIFLLFFGYRIFHRLEGRFVEFI